MENNEKVDKDGSVCGQDCLLCKKRKDGKPGCEYQEICISFKRVEEFMLEKRRESYYLTA